MYSADYHPRKELCIVACKGDATLTFTFDCVELSAKPLVMPVSTEYHRFPFEVSQNRFCKRWFLETFPKEGGRGGGCSSNQSSVVLYKSDFSKSDNHL